MFTARLARLEDALRFYCLLKVNWHAARAWHLVLCMIHLWVVSPDTCKSCSKLRAACSGNAGDVLRPRERCYPLIKAGATAHAYGVVTWACSQPFPKDTDP